MKKFVKWAKSWLTMKRIEFAFMNDANGEPMFVYIDCFGDKWLAEYNRFGYRVETSR